MAVPFVAAGLTALRTAGTQVVKKLGKNAIYRLARRKVKKIPASTTNLYNTHLKGKNVVFKGGTLDKGIKSGAGKVYKNLTKIQKSGTTITRKLGEKKYYTKTGKLTTHTSTINRVKNKKFVKGKTAGYVQRRVIDKKTQTAGAKLAGHAKTVTRGIYDNSNTVKNIGMYSLYGGVAGRISAGSQRRKNKKRRNRG